MEARQDSARYFSYENSTLGKNTVSGQHYHNFFELYFLEEGNCHYFIDSDTYDVQAGDLVFIPEGTIHKTMYGDSEHFRRLIYCDATYVPASLLHRLPDFLCVYRNASLVPQIRAIFDAIEREYTARGELFEDAILHHVQLLFLLLARNTDTEGARKSTNAYTAQTVAYIKKHYAEELSLTALAADCAVSPEHLSRLFKRETGFGVAEYITMIRLQQAQRLLRSTALSVTEIAERCGFNDSNYFSGRFKQAYGISPLAYRRAQGI